MTTSVTAVSTSTEDGLVLTGLRLSPPNPHTSVVHIHGMAGGPVDNPWVIPLGVALASAGCEFITGRLRGTGVLSTAVTTDGEDRTTGAAVELVADSPLDVAAWAGVVSTRRVVLSGHSLGATKVVLAAAGLSPAGLLLLAPADMVGLVQRHRLHAHLLEEARQAAEEPGSPPRLLSSLVNDWAPMSPATYLERARRGAPADVLDPAGPPIEGVDMPVHVIIGERDDALCGPASRAHELAGRFVRGTAVVLAGADHQFTGQQEALEAAVLTAVAGV